MKRQREAVSVASPKRKHNWQPSRNPDAYEVCAECSVVRGPRGWTDGRSDGRWFPGSVPRCGEAHEVACRMKYTRRP